MVSPNTIPNRIPRSNFKEQQVKKQGSSQLGEEDRHETQRTRQARGRRALEQAHLDACTMLKVTLEEHYDQWWWRKQHYAGHKDH